MADHDKIRAELNALTIDGVLHPQAVVDFARNPATALHSQFTWDDAEAAEAHRLEQARRVIRVFVVVEPAGDPTPVRAFVSLTTDRKQGGGYRRTVDVVSDADHYAQMLRDALAEISALERKFERIRELRPVWLAAERVRSDGGKQVAA